MEVSTASRENVLMAVSNAMVGLHKEQFGRGPTKARSQFAGKDILVCTLESALTPAERNLVELGEGQRVREMRVAFQAATATKFTETVERITGRTVRSFMSALDATEEVAIEVFIFHPVD
jgi:uncharacterized protein YbcI